MHINITKLSINNKKKNFPIIPPKKLHALTNTYKIMIISHIDPY
jgi:hypothetical protein